jgi:hypothetical protein
MVRRDACAGVRGDAGWFLARDRSALAFIRGVTPQKGEFLPWTAR